MAARDGFGAGVAVFLLCLAACGGRVVVDSSAGAGGSDAGQVSPDAICEAFCSPGQLATCGAGSVPCLTACHDQFASAGPCVSFYTAEFTCYAERFASEGCGPPECQHTLSDRDACITPAGACVGEECEIKNGTCERTCGGVDYAVECPPTGGPPQTSGPTCTCKVGGKVVGTCAANSLDPFIWGGCCTSYFATSG